MTKYNKAAVDQAIARSRQPIDSAEAKAIHRLLSGRHAAVPEPDPLAENSAEGAGGEVAISPARFVAGLERLGYNVSTAHRLLGCGRSTIYRMANGQAVVPGVVMRLMDMYERFGVPEEHKA